jgi:hypothetical protein
VDFFARFGRVGRLVVVGRDPPYCFLGVVVGGAHPTFLLGGAVTATGGLFIPQSAIRNPQLKWVAFQSAFRNSQSAMEMAPTFQGRGWRQWPRGSVSCLVVVGGAHPTFLLGVAVTATGGLFIPQSAIRN